MRSVPLAIARLLSHRCTITYDEGYTTDLNNLIDPDDEGARTIGSTYFYLTDEGARNIDAALALMDRNIRILHPHEHNNKYDDMTRAQIDLADLRGGK